MTLKFKAFQKWYKRKQRGRVGSYTDHEKVYDTIIVCSKSFDEVYRRLEKYYELEGIRFDCDFEAILDFYKLEKGE